MHKQKVCVLFGGVSSEHDISLISAENVISSIDKNKYDIIMLGISKSGEWFIYTGDAKMLHDDRWLQSDKIEKAFISPDTSVHGIICENGEQIHIDVAFPVLHGKNGEDGTVQGLFQLAKIPFVGCNMTSSALCMDKEFSNAIADVNNILQAKWLSISKVDYDNSIGSFEKAAIKKLGLPIFVKPANAGSSIGVSKASSADELSKALTIAFNEDSKVVLEEAIVGSEVECAVLGNTDPITGEVGQIIAGAEFYDFDAKYNNIESKTLIPANLPEGKRNEIRQTATKIYKAFGCSGLARVDFFVEAASKKVLFNEINTIPGQTAISMYPGMMKAVGIEYNELLDKLIELAIEK